jgi:hypothetical protein
MDTSDLVIYDFLVLPMADLQDLCSEPKSETKTGDQEYADSPTWSSS